MRTIFIARRKHIDLLFPLQYHDVFQRTHQPSAKRQCCQNYGGLLQSLILIYLLIYTLFDVLALHTRRSTRVSLSVQPDLAIIQWPRSTKMRFSKSGFKFLKYAFDVFREIRNSTPKIFGIICSCPVRLPISLCGDRTRLCGDRPGLCGDQSVCAVTYRVCTVTDQPVRCPIGPLQ